MTLTTEDVRAIVAARSSVIGLKPLCRVAEVSYYPLRARIARGGQLKTEEGEKLGVALLAALPAGWILIFSQRNEIAERSEGGEG
jgi:hypothetical protein